MEMEDKYVQRMREILEDTTIGDKEQAVNTNRFHSIKDLKKLQKEAFMEALKPAVYT